MLWPSNIHSTPVITSYWPTWKLIRVISDSVQVWRIKQVQRRYFGRNPIVDYDWLINLFTINCWLIKIAETLRVKSKSTRKAKQRILCSPLLPKLFSCTRSLQKAPHRQTPSQHKSINRIQLARSDSPWGSISYSLFIFINILGDTSLPPFE